MADNSDINPNCQITNNSGQDIVILNAADSSTNAEHAVPEMIYQQTLTVLTLASGATILANGKTDTVVLDGTFTDSHGKVLPNLAYELIFADPVTLSPVKNAFVDAEFDENTMQASFPAITIEAADAKQMASAILFYQVTSAYPSSKLAKGFVAALQSTDGSLSAKSEATMNAYFQQTTGYTTVDFNSYMAASTYASTFAASWVPPQTDVPYNTDRAIPEHKTNSYWLYSDDNMGGGTVNDSGRTPATKASCLGVVVFTSRKSASPADPTDHNSGWTIVYSTDGYAIDGGNSVTNLIFDKEQFVDKITDIPGIALAPVLAVKGTFTGDTTDTSLWPVLVGNVGGVKVIGVAMRPEDGWDKFANFWQSLTFQSVINNFLMIMGLVMAVDFIKTKVGAEIKSYREKKANENKGKEPDANQEKQIQEDADTVSQKAQANQNDLAKRMGNDASGKPNVEVPDQAALPQVQQNVIDSQVKASNNRSADGYDRSLKETDAQIKEIGKYGINQDLEQAEFSKFDAEKSLPTARQSGDFSDVKTNLGNARTSVNQAAQDFNASQDVLDNIKTSQGNQAEFEEVAEEVNENSKTVEDGETTDEGFEPGDG